jgi:hypothetical protein
MRNGRTDSNQTGIKKRLSLARMNMHGELIATARLQAPPRFRIESKETIPSRGRSVGVYRVSVDKKFGLAHMMGEQTDLPGNILR